MVYFKIKKINDENGERYVLFDHTDYSALNHYINALEYRINHIDDVYNYHGSTQDDLSPHDDNYIPPQPPYKREGYVSATDCLTLRGAEVHEDSSFYYVPKSLDDLGPYSTTHAFLMMTPGCHYYVDELYKSNLNKLREENKKLQDDYESLVAEQLRMLEIKAFEDTLQMRDDPNIMCKYSDDSEINLKLISLLITSASESRRGVHPHKVRDNLCQELFYLVNELPDDESLESLYDHEKFWSNFPESWRTVFYYKMNDMLSGVD